MKRRLRLLFVPVAVVLSGCGSGPDPGLKPVSISDPNLAPMLQAIAAAERLSLGFTAIPTNAYFSLKMVDPRSGCDAMLFVNTRPNRRTIERMITFRKAQNGYRWTGELEKHYGPASFSDFQGTLQENLVIGYHTEPQGGLPPNQVYVIYHGQDSRLTGRSLTLADIQPFLESWKGIPIR